jgi:hypothetical protein
MDNIVTFPGVGNNSADSVGKVGNANLQASNIIKRGQAVLPRLECNLSWDAEWRDLILALGFGRELAMRTAGTDQPQGPKYRAAIGVWLRCYGFEHIEKADRSRLIECFDHLDEINAWRSALSAKKQDKLNHPRTVLAHWKRSLAPEPIDNGNTEPPPPAGMITVDTVIAWLANTKLSTEDRKRIISSLAIVRSDVSTAVAADIVQHAVAQAREVAEQEQAALAKCVAGVRAAVRTQASPAHQLEDVKAALGRHKRAQSEQDWLEQMDPESLFPKPAPDPDQETLLQQIGRGKTAAPTDPATSKQH